MRPLRCRVTILLLLGLTLAAASRAEQAAFPGCSTFVRYFPDLNASSLFYAPADSTINTASVWYQASSGHCTSVRAEIWIDARYVGDTGWVPPNGVSAVYDVTAFTQGGDSVIVSLINPVCNGGEGCCPPSGQIDQNWGGYLCLTGTLSGPPTSAQDDLAARAGDGIRLFLHPNPGSAEITVSWEAPRLSDSILRVYDVGGRLVKTLQSVCDAPVASGAVCWDCRDMNGMPVASGTYMVLLSSASGHRVQRVVVLR